MTKIETYLQRINYTGPLALSAEALRALHQAHLLAIPFENLDIHLGRPIIPDEATFYRKIVEQRRGGFCYELNGLFAWLLRQLGFDVTLLSARVTNGNGTFGPEFDHLTLLVQLEERWLADVGFGDCFRDPLRLDEPGEQVQALGSYRLTHTGEQWVYWQRGEALNWQPQYQFTLQPRQLTDFAEMCHIQQIASESYFTRQRICSLATPSGRISLSDRRLIITSNGRREEQLLADEAAVEATLTDWFGVRLGEPGQTLWP